MEQNKIYFKKTTDLQSKLKGWKIFGGTVGVSLIGIITILVLT